MKEGITTRSVRTPNAGAAILSMTVPLGGVNTKNAEKSGCWLS